MAHAASTRLYDAVRERYERLAAEVLRPRRLRDLRRWLAGEPRAAARWGPLPEEAMGVAGPGPDDPGSDDDAAANAERARELALDLWAGLLRGISRGRPAGTPRRAPAVVLAKAILRHPWLGRRLGRLPTSALFSVSAMPGGFALVQGALAPAALVRGTKRLHLRRTVHAVVKTVAAYGDRGDARALLARLRDAGLLARLNTDHYASAARNPRRDVFEFYAGPFTAAIVAARAERPPAAPDGEQHYYFPTPGLQPGSRAAQRWREEAARAGPARVAALEALVLAQGAAD